jgi:uncharacterized protein YbjT (DUF2867 family)
MIDSSLKLRKMKILILGGTGRTGRYFLNDALERGHTAHVLVRDPGKLTIHSDRLTVIQGVPIREEDLKEAMAGCEAVVSALNISRKSDFPWAKRISPPDLLSTSIHQVVNLAPVLGIDRVIVISAAGVGDSEKYMPRWFRWIINSSNIGITYRDHNLQEQLLRDSKLRWTAVRPVGLSNSEKDKPVRVTIPGVQKPGFTIGRKNVARFILDILEHDQYVHETPIISE